MGRGTAYALSMPAVASLRAQLARAWQPWLTAQDRQPWQPHLTVQNKVAAKDARRLHDMLQNDFTPCEGMVLGIGVWRYLGGPWEKLGHQAFSGTIA